jgi:Protein of unknown function (DUF2971)
VINLTYDKTKKPKYIYHYTTIEGCQGILENQVLHASNIAFLNDRKELRYVDDFIRCLVEARFNEMFSDLQTRKIMTERVDIPMLSQYESSNFIDSIHKISRKVSPIFIVSFCRANSIFVEQNGILSQWRGYGRDGGIALRFEVEQLESICKAESKKYVLMSTFVGDVIYGEGDPEFDDGIRRELEVFGKATPDIVEGILEAGGISHRFDGERASLNDMYRPYNSIAPRLKHPGFSEEAEYRLAMSVWSGGPDPDDNRTQKQIHFRKRENYLLPYIKINEATDRPLPIDQIIIGPSSEMDRRIESIESLVRKCGVEAEILTSTIPFA